MSMPALKQHDNSVWYIHWSDGRRSKRESTGTKEVAAAKAYLGQWLLMDREAPIAASDFTVAELWESYHRDHIGKNVASVDTADYAWANIKQHFGGLTSTKITQKEVESYEAKRAAGTIGRPAQSSTVRRELGTLRACLNWCADPKRHILAPADVPLFDLPEDGEARDRWLTKAEVQKLLAAATGRTRLFLWLALATAARATAILQLTWDRIDFETGMIHYDVPGRKKTKKRRVSVPMSSALRPVLRRAWQDAPRDWRSQMQEPRVVGINSRNYAYKAVAAAAKKAGVAGVGPHVLRHTAATHMAREGISLFHIGKVLGDTVATVEKHYAKHTPAGMLEAVNATPGGMLEAAE